MRISDWSSDVCSSDLTAADDLPGREHHMHDRCAMQEAVVGRSMQGPVHHHTVGQERRCDEFADQPDTIGQRKPFGQGAGDQPGETGVVPLLRLGGARPEKLAIKDPGRRIRWRSEEHTSELQSLMRISYAVFCLKKKKREPEATEYD